MFTENRNQFFVTTDFGVPVLFKRGATTLGTINAIFDSPAQELAVYDRSFYDEKFYSAKVALNQPSLLCVSEDAAGLQVNDTAQVDGGTTYYIGYFEVDGTGLTRIYLSLDQV